MHKMEGNAMLTRFGKQLRKIRIDRDQRLKDMAEQLNVTVAYLSAVENGNRVVPDSWVYTLSKKYELSEEETVSLQKAAYEGKAEVRISLDDLSKNDLALSFARKFKDLTDDEVGELKKMLDSM